MARYILTPDTDPAGTPVFVAPTGPYGIVKAWTGDTPQIVTDDGADGGGGIPLPADQWQRLACDDCGSTVLDEYACPNDTHTCVDCCPCHREDDADDAATVSPVESYGCETCGHALTSATYVADCPACRSTGTVYADSRRLPAIVGVINADMFGRDTAPGERVDWSAPDYYTANDFAALVGQDVATYAAASPHMIVFVADHVHPSAR